jgi:hypothetical protein
MPSVDGEKSRNHGILVRLVVATLDEKTKGKVPVNYLDGPPAPFSFFLSFFSGLGSQAGGSLAGKDSREASSTGSTTFGSGGFGSGFFSSGVLLLSICDASNMPIRGTKT